MTRLRYLSDDFIPGFCLGCKKKFPKCRVIKGLNGSRGLSNRQFNRHIKLKPYSSCVTHYANCKRICQPVTAEECRTNLSWNQIENPMSGNNDEDDDSVDDNMNFGNHDSYKDEKTVPSIVNEKSYVPFRVALKRYILENDAYIEPTKLDQFVPKLFSFQPDKKDQIVGVYNSTMKQCSMGTRQSHNIDDVQCNNSLDNINEPVTSDHDNNSLSSNSNESSSLLSSEEKLEDFGDALDMDSVDGHEYYQSVPINNEDTQLEYEIHNRMNLNVASPHVGDEYLSADMSLFERWSWAKEVQIGFKPNNQLTAEVKLLHILEAAKCPLNMFDKIMNWAKESSDFGNDFSATPRKRDEVFSEMKKFCQEHSVVYRPRVVNFAPDDRKVTIYVQEFRDALFSLLTNPIVANSSSYAFPDPFDPYVRKSPGQNRFLSELHHGKWQRDTHKTFCKENSLEVPLPLILYMDGVQTDRNGKLEAIPCSMTLGIFKEKVRRQPEAWTTLYFHPPDVCEEAFHKGETKAIHKNINLHRCLDEVFDQLAHIQNSGRGIYWELDYGGKTHQVIFKPFVAFVVGDTDMHNKLCSKKGGGDTICRHCDCPHVDLVNGDRDRRGKNKLNEMKSFVEAHERGDSTYFNATCHYQVYNAFYKLNFGCNPYNIHLATPGEMLHMHQKGLELRIPECLENLLRNPMEDQADKKGKDINASIRNLDKLAIQYSALLSRSSDRDFPKTRTRHSHFKSSKRAAHEQQGVLLNLLLALLSDRGRQIMIAERTLSEEHILDHIYMIELAISLEQWMKKLLFDRAEILGCRDVMHDVVDKIDSILTRGGEGNNLVKYHLYLHLWQYLNAWGPFIQMDSGHNERFHKTEIKPHAQTTQRRYESFRKQLALRISESSLLHRVLYIIDQHEKSNLTDNNVDSMTEKLVGGISYKYGCTVDGSFEMKWNMRHGKNLPNLQQPVLDFIKWKILPELPDEESSVFGFTVHKIIKDVNVSILYEHTALMEQKRYIFRSTPAYKSSCGRSDVWYDWGLFKYPIIDDARNRVPGQILTFLKIPAFRDRPRFITSQACVDVPEVFDYQESDRCNELYAVVRFFKEETSYEKRCLINTEERGTSFQYISDLVGWGETEDRLCLVPLNCLICPLRVVPNIATKRRAKQYSGNTERYYLQKELEVDPIGGWFVVTNRSYWCHHFTSATLEQHAMQPDCWNAWRHVEKDVKFVAHKA